MSDARDQGGKQTLPKVRSLGYHTSEYMAHASERKPDDESPRAAILSAEAAAIRLRMPNKGGKVEYAAPINAKNIIPPMAPLDDARKQTEARSTATDAKENAQPPRHSAYQGLFHESEATRLICEGKLKDTYDVGSGVFSADAITSMAKTDVNTGVLCIGYHTARILRALEVKNYLFALPTDSGEETKWVLKQKLRVLNRKRKTVTATLTAKNEKYTYAPLGKGNLPKSKATAAAKIRARALELLIRRHNINLELSALYSLGTEEVTAKNEVDSEISEARKKSAKASYKAYRPIYDEIKKFRLPRAGKEQVFALINRRTELCALLGEQNLLLKKEKDPVAKQEIANDAANTKKEVQGISAEIKRLAKKMGRQSKYTPDPKIQLLWLAALIAVIALGVAAFALLPELIESFISQNFGDYIK